MTFLMYAFIGLVFLICFLCGLAWSDYRRIPLGAGAVVLMLYLAYVVSTAIWVASCPNCNMGTDDTRAFALFVAIVLYWIAPAVLLATIGLGIVTSIFLRSLRESRGSSHAPH
jgi:hypothetical protein